MKLKGRQPGRLLLAAVVLAASACSSSAQRSAVDRPTSSSSAPPTTSATPTSVTPAPASLPLAATLLPWPLPTDARPYIAAAGLEPLSHETLQVHYHAHLDIIADGRPYPVAAGIGFVFTDHQPVALSPLHTHDESGIIHIESAVDKPFTLGQVFIQWGVRLSSNQMGGLTAGNGRDLRLYVNGVRQTVAPESLVLLSHQEITLWYGSSSAQPVVPSSYQFPAGY